MKTFDERFINHISKTKKISKAEAVNYIDECIKKVAIEKRKSYAEIYATIFDPAYLEKCLVDKCSSLDIEECKQSQTCVYFEGECYSRVFPDVIRMNKDPDRYIEKMSTADLEKLVKIASYLYYNFEGGGLTDNAFDTFHYRLNQRLKIRHRRYEKIGAPPVDKIRTLLPYPMGSLQKVKPGTRALYNFLNGIPKIIYSSKLDGVSGMIVYTNGKLDKIYTRGDGTIGGDVTYLKSYINNIPERVNQEGVFAVRGEFILPKSKWLKYEKSYGNPRSFVSAKINTGVITSGLQDIDFIAYQIVFSEKKGIQGVETFQTLDLLGFKVVEYGVFNDPVIFDIITEYKERRASSEYSIDGLVLSKPGDSVAFKMLLESQTRESMVTNVEWDVTRYGKYQPVAIFEGVVIDGVRLHRATAFNAAHVRDWSMGEGTHVTVVRSGDVIPQIKNVQVDESIEPIFPEIAYPGKDEPAYAWHWQGRDIFVNEVDGNERVQIKRLEHFFETIEVPRIREKTLQKLWNAGMKEVKDVTSASPEDFMEIRGIGEKSAFAHYSNIHNTMRKTRLDRFLVASTTFQSRLGRKIVKRVMRDFPNIFEKTESEIREFFKSTKVKGVGPKTAEKIAEGIPKFMKFLYSLNKDDIEHAIKYDKERVEKIKEAGYNDKIRGKTFVLTGFHGTIDYDLEDAIYDNLGDFTTVLTNRVDAVIAYNLYDITDKMINAHEMGIPVYSLDEFIAKFDIDHSRREHRERREK